MLHIKISLPSTVFSHLFSCEFKFKHWLFLDYFNQSPRMLIRTRDWKKFKPFFWTLQTGIEDRCSSFQSWAIENICLGVTCLSYFSHENTQFLQPPNNLCNTFTSTFCSSAYFQLTDAFNKQRVIGWYWAIHKNLDALISLILICCRYFAFLQSKRFIEVMSTPIGKPLTSDYAPFRKHRGYFLGFIQHTHPKTKKVFNVCGVKNAYRWSVNHVCNLSTSRSKRRVFYLASSFRDCYESPINSYVLLLHMLFYLSTILLDVFGD